MQRNYIDQEIDHSQPTDDADRPVEEREHPIEGVKHKPEPDAENMMPVEDRPGTF
jgi:hypothetical protein